MPQLGFHCLAVYASVCWQLIPDRRDHIFTGIC